MQVILLEGLVAVGLLTVLAIAWFAGKLLGRTMHGHLAEHRQLGVVQAAILGLLGLLLGFCFAGAVSRFVERQEILVREANAATTLYDRADLLSDSHKSKLKVAVREYLAARHKLFDAAGVKNDRAIQSELLAIQDRMWTEVRAGITERPEYALLLGQACTDVSDSLAIRNAAELRHIPSLVLAVLIFCAVASVTSIGLGVEKSDKRLRRPAFILILLIAAALWTTIDLDFPRVGLIRLDPQPLTDAADKTSGLASPASGGR